MNLIKTAIMTFIYFTQYMGIVRALIMVALWFTLWAVYKRAPAELAKHKDTSKLANFFLYDFKSKKCPNLY